MSRARPLPRSGDRSKAVMVGVIGRLQVSARRIMRHEGDSAAYFMGASSFGSFHTHRPSACCASLTGTTNEVFGYRHGPEIFFRPLKRRAMIDMGRTSRVARKMDDRDWRRPARTH